jgi:hypothetical protein
MNVEIGPEEDFEWGRGRYSPRCAYRKGVTGEIFGDTRNTHSKEWYEINGTSIGRVKKGYPGGIQCTTIDKSKV